MKSMHKFPAGSNGWGVCVVSGKGEVQAAITGPQEGFYAGDWMTPEQAEAIGIGFIQAAQAAREKKTAEQIAA
jgi:hypothetical protein